ncbi:hypothetical protein CFAM422_001971 [Trichoderma lentiforme]|uniref:Uncharacterized protein n=1 Tax=Trichoderma lentiforme TaxID=1567552 RepID=A0A9P4XMI1_9HYPO|nr:hypothetical protein CFAM422_001971 [Trichoderma lentiforme]
MSLPGYGEFTSSLVRMSNSTRAALRRARRTRRVAYQREPLGPFRHGLQGSTYYGSQTAHTTKETDGRV